MLNSFLSKSLLKTAVNGKRRGGSSRNLAPPEVEELEGFEDETLTDTHPTTSRKKLPPKPASHELNIVDEMGENGDNESQRALISTQSLAKSSQIGGSQSQQMKQKPVGKLVQPYIVRCMVNEV